MFTQSLIFNLTQVIIIFLIGFNVKREFMRFTDLQMKTSLFHNNNNKILNVNDMDNKWKWLKLNIL